MAQSIIGSEHTFGRLELSATTVTRELDAGSKDEALNPSMNIVASSRKAKHALGWPWSSQRGSRRRLETSLKRRKCANSGHSPTAMPVILPGHHLGDPTHRPRRQCVGARCRAGGRRFVGAGGRGGTGRKQATRSAKPMRRSPARTTNRPLRLESGNDPSSARFLRRQ